jgi:4-amino-4-deoxy-L-arabinose transferase-like glycosyltransferase
MIEVLYNENIMDINISEYIKRYWQWLLILLSMSVGQFLVLDKLPVSMFFYRAPMTQISTVLPNIGPLEYENDDQAHGLPLRWTANTGEIRLLGGLTQSDVLLSLLVHTGRPVGSTTTLTMTNKAGNLVFQSTLSAGWRRIWLLLPASSGSDGYQTISYQIDGVALADRRMLGVAVGDIARYQMTTAPDVAHLFAGWAYGVMISCGLVLVMLRQRWHWGFGLASLCMVLLVQGFWPLEWSLLVPRYWSTLGWGLVLCVLWWAAPHRRAYLSIWASVVGVLCAIGLLRIGYVGVGALVLIGIWFTMPTSVVTRGPLWEPRWGRWLLLGAVIAGVLLRVVWLDGFPQGMFRDEARHGGLAQQVLSGDWIIYSPFANLPAGYFYLSAIPIWLFGPSAFAIRIVAALVGSATIVVSYWALYPWWGKSFALLMSLVLTPFLWHMGLSRIGFPATIGPFLTLLAVGMVWRGLSNPVSWRTGLWGLGAGLVTGAMTLGYHSARLMPIVVGLTIVAHWYTYRWRWLAQWRILISWCIGTAITAAPIVWYASTQSYNYMKRIDVTSLASNATYAGIPLWVALQQNVLAYVGMFLVAGDENARHFFMGMPQLNLIEGLGFVVGIVALWYRRDVAVLWLLAYLVVAITPGILSVDAPHALRTVEATIPTVMIVAYGLWVLLQSVLPRWRISVVIVLVSLGCVWSAGTYLQWQNDRRTYGEFDGQLTNAVRYVQATNDMAIHHATQWYLPVDWRNGDVGVYLLRGMTIASYDRGRIEPSTAATKLFLLDATTPAPAQSQEIALPASLATHAGEFRLWCNGQCGQLDWLH